jgi:hypothetical protein
LAQVCSSSRLLQALPLLRPWQQKQQQQLQVQVLVQVLVLPASAAALQQAPRVPARLLLLLQMAVAHQETLHHQAASS